MRRAALVLVAWLVVACKRDAPTAGASGGGGGVAVAGACFRDRDSACTEYGAAGIVAAERMCGGFRWIAGDAGCPREGRIGACLHDDGKVVDIVYEGPPNRYTPAAAKAACQNGGGQFVP